MNASTSIIAASEAYAGYFTPYQFSSREAGGVGMGTRDRILSYINHTQKLVSRIFPTKTVLGSHPPTPRVAAFSSKSPNALIPEILKPDVTALIFCKCWRCYNIRTVDFL
ncbi:hypothetical protein AAG906_039656 [Vitis piasezkii]